MAENPEEISLALAELVRPETRGRLLAQGLARGMVWKGGLVPDGAPDFSASLTPDLLDFGYGVLALALELRDANRNRNADQQFDTLEAFRVAAEAIESAIRRGDPDHGDHGRHLVISAAAFHLAGFAARSFSLLPIPALTKNLASHERTLGLLLRHDFPSLRDQVMQWHTNPAGNDETIARRLLDENDMFGPEDAAVLALSTSYHSAVGLADTALLLGTVDTFDTAVAALEAVIQSSSQIGNIPTWWVATLTLHLLHDLWDQSLYNRLPSGSPGGIPQRWTTLRRDFISLLGTRRPPQISLWPSQLAAATRATDPNDDLVIALPTSAGKTRIAELCILRTLADKKRTIYVTPLRALSAQVERVLARTFVPMGASVTSLYGASGATLVDTQTLVSADIVVATPEKLDFAIRQDATVLDDVGLIVFDEGHMIGLGSREIRYEVLIQRLLRRTDAEGRRIVCLSAMFNPDDPYFKDFGNWLRNDAPGDFVHVQWRPTRQRLATLDWSSRTSAGRLAFLEDEKPFVPRFVEEKAPRKPRKNPFPQNEVEFCICAANGFARDGHTVLVYSPLRSQVEPLAREFRHMRDQGYLDNVKTPRPEVLAVAQAIGREWLGTDHAAVRALEAGVGTHHGALPRPFLSAVEELLDARKLSVVVASPTLAQGIDLACSVLIFRSLRRYEDGNWVSISPAEFANVVGRAGRAYVDLDGISVLPTFDPQSRQQLHTLFNSLVKASRGQTLVSGLAQLIGQIAGKLAQKLGVPSGGLLEYVLNQRDLWEDARLLADKEAGEEDQIEDTLLDNVSDLDVALFSLIEPLDIDADQLATALDEALKGSLWQRTLKHLSAKVGSIEQEIFHSRAEWIWNRTTAKQRAACFYSGLGYKAGLFLHDQLDILVDTLCDLQAAVAAEDGDSAATAAVEFADLVMREPFFAVRRLPEKWEDVLKAWVNGTAFSEILDGRNARDAQRTQAFVQEGTVFRLVWAAEAVRVQAIATEHSRVDELGDGPAFALTYGVPSIPAALLCQMGFSSRVGSIWVTKELSANFTDTVGLHNWLREHDASLSEPEFWISEDHFLLWSQASRSTTTEHPRPWRHETHTISANWNVAPPSHGNGLVRVIPGNNRTVTICRPDLRPIGTAGVPFDPRGAALEGKIMPKGKVQVMYFGQS